MPVVFIRRHPPCYIARAVLFVLFIFCSLVSALELKTEHCKIIELRRFSDECADSIFDIAQDPLRVCLRIDIERIDHAIRSEQLVRSIGSFRNTVSIYKDLRTRLKLQLILLVAVILHSAENQSVLVSEDLKIAIPVPDRRIFMPGIGSLKYSCGKVQNTKTELPVFPFLLRLR